MQTDAAPGIHRIEDAFVNWYLIEEEGRLTVVDRRLKQKEDSQEDDAVHSAKGGASGAR